MYKTLYNKLKKEQKKLIDEDENWNIKAALQGNFNWGTLTLGDAVSINFVLNPEKPFDINLFAELFNTDIPQLKKTENEHL